MSLLPLGLKEKAKDCLTPVPPLRGSTGGIKESMKRKP